VGKVKIKITSHWSVPPEEGYSIGDEYNATLNLCDKSTDAYYAILDNGYTIPNGNFEVLTPVVDELTPDLAGEIFDSVQMKILGDRLAKDYVLHHLKQLKAQIAKLPKKHHISGLKTGISMCLDAIDKKIEKVSKIK